MTNKMNIASAIKEFKHDDWFKPMLHFVNHEIKDITIDLVKEYLDSQGFEYHLRECDNDNDSFTFDISSTNQYDLGCIFKRGDTHFHTNHVYNEVRTVSYMSITPDFTTKSILISLKHNDGWLVSNTAWNHWLACRFDLDEEDVQDNRNIKVNTLLNDKSGDRMSEDFNYHLIRHIKKFKKVDSDRFVSSVFEYYRKNGIITKKQLNVLKSVMYNNKGYMY